MTESQDIKVAKKLGTDTWHYLAEVGSWKVYETNDGFLFAVSNNSEKVSFEVYPDEDSEYLIY